MPVRKIELGRNERRFNKFDPKWNCCCNTHCETGAAVIGILQWLVALPVLIFGFTRIHSTTGVGNVIGGLLMLLVGALILLAVNLQRPGLLLPVLFIYVIQIGVLTASYVIIMAMFLISLVFGNAWSPFANVQSYSSSQLMVLAIALIIESVIRFWFFHVLWKCRCYLQEKQMASRSSEVRVIMIAQPQSAVVDEGGRDTAVMQRGQLGQQISVAKATDKSISSPLPGYESLPTEAV